LIKFSLSACHQIINGETKYTAEKLGATFNKRKYYVTHYANLKTYIQLGLKVTKIHRVLGFKQTLFLKSYIDAVTVLRTNAVNEFDRALFKLMINSVFGKFIERTRDYMNVRFCKKEDVCTNLITNPRFVSMKIISEDLVAIFLKQATVSLNKPLAIGFSILERSKDYMYKSFYQQIRPKLKHADVQVIFSDTDSFGLLVTSDANSPPVDSLEQLRDIFDFSNYPVSSPRYCEKNASKLGYFKDELQGSTMTEFIGLRSKSYGFKYKEEGKEAIFKSKCKGITRGYRKTLGFENYKKCIDTFSKTVLQQYHIRSENHRIKLIKVRKTCFSSFDDKRYIFSCGKHTTPYNSVLIKTAEKNNKCPFC
jgi:hypothetical protein